MKKLSYVGLALMILGGIGIIYTANELVRSDLQKLSFLCSAAGFFIREFALHRIK